MRSERARHLMANHQPDDWHSRLEHAERQRDPQFKRLVNARDADRDRGREVAESERYRDEKQGKHRCSVCPNRRYPVFPALSTRVGQSPPPLPAPRSSQAQPSETPPSRRLEPSRGPIRPRRLVLRVDELPERLPPPSSATEQNWLGVASASSNG